MSISHEWDEEDYLKTLEDAWAEYRLACYGRSHLPSDQVRETRQAFLSGIVWLNARDHFCPDDLARALAKLLNIRVDK